MAHRDTRPQRSSFQQPVISRSSATQQIPTHGRSGRHLSSGSTLHACRHTGGGVAVRLDPSFFRSRPMSSRRILLHTALWLGLYGFWLLATHDHHPTITAINDSQYPWSPSEPRGGPPSADQISLSRSECSPGMPGTSDFPDEASRRASAGGFFCKRLQSSTFHFHPDIVQQTTKENHYGVSNISQ